MGEGRRLTERERKEREKTKLTLDLRLSSLSDSFFVGLLKASSTMNSKANVSKELNAKHKKVSLFVLFLFIIISISICESCIRWLNNCLGSLIGTCSWIWIRRCPICISRNFESEKVSILSVLMRMYMA